MSCDTGYISASVSLDQGCDIRKQFCGNDATFWFESTAGAFDLCILDDGMAEKLRDLFAEAAEHFARMRARTDEEIAADEEL